MKATKTLIPLSLAIVALAYAMPGAHAQGGGKYDGMWIVDAAEAQGAGTSPRSSGCEPVRIPFQVVGNQIRGSLQRSVYGTGRVEGGTGRNSAPITGTIQPDGSLTAQWQSYKATGKLSGENAEIKWSGECGPRVATGGRIEGTGPSAGSSKQR